MSVNRTVPYTPDFALDSGASVVFEFAGFVKVAFASSSRVDRWDRMCLMQHRLSCSKLKPWLLLGWVTAERSCPCKQPACSAAGGGSEVTFKQHVICITFFFKTR
ncbi:hypothetical protein J6590_014023 [Homalodisca vitripennis]|nr:hypothetical protein J6590_014023 [Homalodisca vitripennis]